MTKRVQAMELIKYDVACRALAEAKQVDEVLQIRNVAAAMKEYGAARERPGPWKRDGRIRMRAARRLDEMRRAQKETVELAKGGKPYTGSARDPVTPPTLRDAGIGKHLAHEGRKLGAL